MKKTTVSVRVDKKYLKDYGEKKYYVYFGNFPLFHFVNRFKGMWHFWSVGGGEFAKPFAVIESADVPMEQIRNLAHAFATIFLRGETIDELVIDGARITVNKDAGDYPEQN